MSGMEFADDGKTPTPEATAPIPAVEPAATTKVARESKAGFEMDSGDDAPPAAPEQPAYREQCHEEWHFAKNIHTQQKIPLPDGTIYQFKETKLVTGDRNLAEQLIAVADRYRICVNQQPPVKTE